MNKEQRKQLQKYVDDLNDIASSVREMADEEQEKADNMPENLQESERHEAYENAVYLLNDLADNIENATSDVEELL